MAKQLYWSIQTGGGSSSPPPGLGCLTQPDSLLVAYISDSAEPGAVLVNPAHSDVLSFSVVRGRRVAVLVCRLVNAAYSSGSGIWELLVEYDDEALQDEERELTHCDICQIECLTCDAQAKIMGGGSSGETDPEWLASLESYLDENTDLDPGDLDDLTPEP